MLESEGTLHTIAEVAVALAGFAALVAIFRQRDTGTWTPAALSALRFMIELSIALVIIALFPIPLHLLGLEGPVMWGISSGVYAFVSLAILTLNTVRIFKLLKSGWRPKTWGFHAVGFTVGIAVILISVLNVAIYQNSGLYVLALLSGVFLVGLQFIAFSSNRSV